MENMKYGTFSMSNFPNIMMSSTLLPVLFFKLLACLYRWQGCVLQIVKGMDKSQQGDEGHRQNHSGSTLVVLQCCFAALTMTTV